MQQSHFKNVVTLWSRG